MSQLRVWRLRFAGLFGKERKDRELAEELESHLQMHIEDNLRSGMDPQQARRQALIKLGGVEQTKESYRERRGLLWMESLLQDIRFGARLLRKSPGFTVVAVLTLGLGIGANTAAFSVVNAILLRSLPFRDPGRIVSILETHPRIPEIGIATADLEDWRSQARAFEGFGAYAFAGYEHLALSRNGEPIEIRGAIVSHDLFPLLGINPALGRSFLASEDQQDQGPVVILSGELWRTHYGAASDILGRSISLDGKNYLVVGVMPAGVRFPEGIDVWVPLGNLDAADRGTRYFHPLFVIGRLRKDATIAAARSEMATIAQRIAESYPLTNHDIGVKIEPIQERYVGDLRKGLFVLWGTVALVLLMACVNVVSLLSVQAENRVAEMGIRRALGASGSRLIRQSLTESVLLAAMGGVCAFAIAFATVPLLASRIPGISNAPILHLHEIRIDRSVLAFTAGISMLSGLLLGIFAGVRVAHRNPNAVLQPGERISPRSRLKTVNRVAIAAQVGLAVVILISAGLLNKSLRQLVATSPGLRPDDVLTMRISLPKGRYDAPRSTQDTDQMSGFYERLFAKIRAIPSVESVATIDHTLLGSEANNTRFLIDGAPPVKPGDYPTARFRSVTPGYVEAMGIPLLSGRSLEPEDATKSPSPILINEAFARLFFPGQDPIGRKLLVGIASGNLNPLPIVGVVGDVRDLAIEAPAPAEFYLASFSLDATLAVRSRADAAHMSDLIRQAILQVDPSQPIYEVRTASKVFADSMARQRTSAILLGFFSVIALAIAASGVYGVTSYAVAGRTREIGLRVALGAGRIEILRLILLQEMLAAVIGIGLGILASLGATRLLKGLLYGVSPNDAATYGLVCLVLASVALVACYIPARRATKVDAMTALRYE